jgi:hypothetical protein
VLAAVLIGVIVYFLFFRGKSDEDFSDPYADSSSVYSAGTRDTRQTGRSYQSYAGSSRNTESKKGSSRATQSQNFANNPHASYGASSYSAYSNVDG